MSTRTARGLACAILVSTLAFVQGCATADPARVAAEQAIARRTLELPGSGVDSDKIDFARLPAIAGAHAVVNAPDPVLKFQLHSYLVHHDGLYWCMWSQGPPSEDEPSQQVRYATSRDGLAWSEPRALTGVPAEGYGYIARGFWVREGRLHALAAHFKGKGAFGANKELELRAFEWDAPAARWTPRGRLFEDAINNFPPERLPTGEWMMTRRDARFNVYMLVGGQKSLDDWRSIDVVRRLEVPGFIPDEPIWWPLADGTLVSLYRDNGGSSRLYRSTSRNSGRDWSMPLQTNFPGTPSKMFSLRLGDTQCRALISNANPAIGRRQLYLATSPDGVTFTRMGVLSIPMPRQSTVQYPHAIVHDGHLLVTYSRNKAAIEVLRVPLDRLRGMCE